jgi:enamine deaminase RidA (YjgF/YER057c/UK114 family)
VHPRTRVASGSPFEPTIGFSRAVRVGDRVLVSGTAPVFPDGSCPDDAAAQARRCFAIIGAALAEAGASFADVVRSRVLLTDVADAGAVAAVHGEVYGDVRPAATMVAVAALLDPRWKVEIEAEALVAEPVIAEPVIAERVITGPVITEPVAAPRLQLALVVDLPADAVAPFAAYERRVLPLLARHGGRLDRRLRTADGRTEIHLLSFADRAGYDAYAADPDRAAAAPLLDGLDVRRRVLEVTDADPGETPA